MLDQTGNTDRAGSQYLGDLGDHSRTIFDLQSQIVTADDLIFKKLPGEKFSGGESGDPLTAVVSQIQRRIGDICHNGTGRGLTAGTATVEEGLPDGIALDHYAVEYVIDIATWVFFWEAIDVYFIERSKNRKKCAILLKLCMAEIEVVKLKKLNKKRENV